MIRPSKDSQIYVYLNKKSITIDQLQREMKAIMLDLKDNLTGNELEVTIDLPNGNLESNFQRCMQFLWISQV